MAYWTTKTNDGGGWSWETHTLTHEVLSKKETMFYLYTWKIYLFAHTLIPERKSKRMHRIWRDELKGRIGVMPKERRGGGRGSSFHRHKKKDSENIHLFLNWIPCELRDNLLICFRKRHRFRWSAAANKTNMHHISWNTIINRPNVLYMKQWDFETFAPILWVCVCVCAMVLVMCIPIALAPCLLVA